MDPLYPWLLLKSAPGIGPVLFKRLVDRFSDPQTVMNQPVESLAQVNGISEKLSRAILDHRMPGSAKKELDLIRENQEDVITLNDERYPELLRRISDPPAFLYCRGVLPALPLAVAIVGSRSATRYGLDLAFKMGRDLAAAGIAVISGLARGIDSAAHRGAVSAGGPTVAVLGSGLLRLYPQENLQLADQITRTGAVVSEFPLETEPGPKHFPVRNRIIAGMSLAVVVVEAARRSGSLITARLAAEQGREVFAVPGSVASSTSAGTHRLLKDGAGLVENAADLVEQLGGTIARLAGPVNAPMTENPDTQQGKEKQKCGTPAALTTQENLVYQALEAYPEHIDDLVRRLEMSPSVLSGLLLQLELKGLAIQEPGKMYLKGASS